MKEFITKEEAQSLIDKAIDKHNKTAALISASLGAVVLFFYAHGLLTVIDYKKWNDIKSNLSGTTSSGALQLYPLLQDRFMLD